jgi:hypothetical protein
MAMAYPGQAKTVSVVKEKTKRPTVASAVAPKRQPGPEEIDSNRDAWADALSTMSNVRTPDPWTALAKVAGMGLAGYGQGKAARDKDKLARALAGEEEPPISLSNTSADTFGMEVPQGFVMPPEDMSPYPGEENDVDPYTDEMNRALHEAETTGNWPANRPHPLLGQTLGPQDHTMLDHELDGMVGNVIKNRARPEAQGYTNEDGTPYTGPLPGSPEWYSGEEPVPGTDDYYQRQTGEPIDLSPAGQVQTRRPPGRFGGGAPMFDQEGDGGFQKSGFQRASAEGEKPAKPIKLTEGQSKDLNYFNRGIYAHDELTELEDALQQPLGVVGNNIPFVGDMVGPAVSSSEYKRADRAAREFIAIVLRKDTGAQVNDSEMRMYQPMYLPSYWDGPEEKQAKREARQRFLDGLYIGSGEARPLFDEVRSGFEAKAKGNSLDAMSDEEIMRQLLGGQ